jgi:uncharacterized protein (TIRG00374 family)
MNAGRDLRWPLAGLLVGIAFLWLAVRGLDLSGVLGVLRQVQPLRALLAIVATFAFMGVKAWRWSMILHPVVDVRFGLLHSVTYIGSAANLVVVHSGELLRALIVGRRANSAPSAILASIGIERIFDMTAVLFLLSGVVLFDRRLDPALAVAAIVAAALVVLGVMVIMLVSRPSRLRSNLQHCLGRVLPVRVHHWVIHQSKRGLSGLTTLGSARAILKVFALSILQWSFIVAAVWLSVDAVGHRVTVPAAIGVWVLMVLGLTLPASPAQLGTTQLAFTLGLALTGAQAEFAFAASVVYVFAVNVPIMIIGACCWLLAGHSGLRPSLPVRKADQPMRP